MTSDWLIPNSIATRQHDSMTILQDDYGKVTWWRLTADCNGLTPVYTWLTEQHHFNDNTTLLTIHGHHTTHDEDD